MTKFLTLLLLTVVLSCQSESRNTTREGSFITPSGATIKTRLAITPPEQEQGLSGVQPRDFDDDQGMLFYYNEDSDKFFWMPDTYFDLDLFYLDKNLVILDIVRRLAHHKGRHNEALIPRARGVWCRHTLEMKSGSKIADSLKVGDRLIWKGSTSLEEIASKVKNIQGD
jgi:uncharacterized membrane protein (UPF0127 family)